VAKCDTISSALGICLVQIPPPLSMLAREGLYLKRDPAGCLLCDLLIRCGLRLRGQGSWCSNRWRTNGRRCVTAKPRIRNELFSGLCKAKNINQPAQCKRVPYSRSSTTNRRISVPVSTLGCSAFSRFSCSENTHGIVKGVLVEKWDGCVIG
jgi:hypothetical protein